MTAWGTSETESSAKHIGITSGAYSRKDPLGPSGCSPAAGTLDVNRSSMSISTTMTGISSGVGLSQTTSGNRTLGLLDLGTTASPDAPAPRQRFFSAGTWKMVARTHNRLEVMRHVDGAHVASAPVSRPLAADTSRLFIGFDPAGTARVFTGQMNDV